MTHDVLRPPAARDLSHQRFVADQALLRQLVSDQATTRHRLRTRRGAVITAGVLAVAATGGVATAKSLLPAEPATVHDSGRCYSMASHDFDSSFPGVGVTMAAAVGAPQPDSVPYLLDMCTTVWRTGGLVLGRWPDATLRPGADVPPLVACVLPSGQAAVFPGRPSVCSDLDLAPLER
jgi:hypothetical protein